MIPDEAVEAAAKAYRREFPYDENERYIIVMILKAAAPHLMAAAEKELADATRMVATLVLKAGGKVSVSPRELAEDFAVLTTTPNVVTGALDIAAYRKPDDAV